LIQHRYVLNSRRWTIQTSTPEKKSKLQLLYTAKQLFMWRWKHCSCCCEFKSVRWSALRPSSCLSSQQAGICVFERAGQMKIEDGIHGNKLLQVAMSLAQECAAAAAFAASASTASAAAAAAAAAIASSPLQQDVLTQPTRRERNRIPQDSVATSHSGGTFADVLTAASAEGVARIWMCFCVRQWRVLCPLFPLLRRCRPFLTDGPQPTGTVCMTLH
jgi:hypothetical protein